MKLSKLHATGNDFLVRMAEHDDVLDPVVVAALCDRHRGVGADGVITIGPGSDTHDCSMLLQNADGGVAEMSGNGIRCLAWVAFANDLGHDDRLVVATGGGRRDVVVERNASGTVVRAAVDMGPARLGSPIAVVVDDEDREAVPVDMGNPHLVIVVDDPDRVDVARNGARLEHHPNFPHRTNVEFVTATDRDRAVMRVWERGVGETLSCGTGICAAAAVLRRAGLVDAAIAMRVRGGELRVELGDHVRLSGPVVHVFDVTIERSRLIESLS